MEVRHRWFVSFDLRGVVLLCLFCRVLPVWYCLLFVTDSWKSSDMLAGGCANHAWHGNTQEGPDLEESPDKTQFNQNRLIFHNDVVHAFTFSLCEQLLAVKARIRL